MFIGVLVENSKFYLWYKLDWASYTCWQQEGCIMLHPLGSSHIPLCLHTLLLSRLKKRWASSFGERLYRPVGSTSGVFVTQLRTTPEARTEGAVKNLRWA